MSWCECSYQLGGVVYDLWSWCLELLGFLGRRRVIDLLFVLGDSLRRPGTSFIPLCLIDYGKREYKQINWSTLLFDWSQSIQNHFFFVYNSLRYIVLIIMFK